MIERIVHEKKRSMMTRLMVLRKFFQVIVILENSITNESFANDSISNERIVVHQFNHTCVIDE